MGIARLLGAMKSEGHAEKLPLPGESVGTIDIGFSIRFPKSDIVAPTSAKGGQMWGTVRSGRDLGHQPRIDAKAGIPPRSRDHVTTVIGKLLKAK